MRLGMWGGGKRVLSATLLRLTQRVSVECVSVWVREYYHTDVCVYRDDAKCRITPPRAFCALMVPRVRLNVFGPFCLYLDVAVTDWNILSQREWEGRKKILNWNTDHEGVRALVVCVFYFILIFFFFLFPSSFSRPVVFCLKHNCSCFWRCASHHPVIFPRRRLPPCVTWARTDLSSPRNCILAAQPSQSVNEGGGGRKLIGQWTAVFLA